MSTCQGQQVVSPAEVHTCDGVLPDCPTTPSGTNNVVIATCTDDEVCVAGARSAACKPKQCTSGACCDGGKLVAFDVACSAVSVASEKKCGAGVVEQRLGYPACNGVGRECPQMDPSIAWGPWQVIETCGAGTRCDGGACVWDTTTCPDGSGTCCFGGVVASKGTQCGNTALQTRAECSPDGKQVYAWNAYAGCPGNSPVCSTDPADLAWKIASAQCCTFDQICVEAPGVVTCGVGDAGCTEGACCDVAAKKPRPFGTVCDATAKTVTTCIGNAVNTKTARYRCNGYSSLCGTSEASWLWSDWALFETCGATSTCAQQGAGADCVTLSAPAACGKDADCPAGATCRAGKCLPPGCATCASNLQDCI